jgi:hypothetical protein
MIDLFNDACHE